MIVLHQPTLVNGWEPEFPSEGVGTVGDMLFQVFYVLLPLVHAFEVAPHRIEGMAALLARLDHANKGTERGRRGMPHFETNDFELRGGKVC